MVAGELKTAVWVRVELWDSDRGNYRAQCKVSHGLGVHHVSQAINLEAELVDEPKQRYPP